LKGTITAFAGLASLPVIQDELVIQRRHVIYAIALQRHLITIRERPLVCASGIEDDPTTVSFSAKRCHGRSRTMSAMQIPIGCRSECGVTGLDRPLRF
jgi:hypothetical protein